MKISYCTLLTVLFLVYFSVSGVSQWVKMSTPIGLKSTSIRSIIGEDTNLFVACNSGIYHSSDSGTSWKTINNGLTNTEINTLLKKDGSLFAGSNIRYNEPSNPKFPAGIFRSFDFGENWITSNTGLPERSSIVSIITIDSAVIISVQTDGGNNGVYRSVDKAKSWVLTGFGNTLVYTLYKAGPDLFAGTFDKIFRSSDNGNNWSEFSNGLTAHYVRTFAHNDNYIFAGTDDGIFRSSDSGRSWIKIGLPKTIVLNMVQNDKVLYVGTYREGVYRSADNGLSWRSISSGIQNKDIYALLTQDTILYAGSYLDGVYSLHDTNWILTNSDLNNKYVTSLATNGEVLFAGTESGVYRSQNSISNWVPVSNGLKSIQVKAIAVSDSVLYVGTNTYLIPPDSGSSDGGVFISRNNGGEWFESNSGLSDSVTGSVMGFVSFGDSILFASTYRNGVSRSMDNGTHWIQPGNSELSNKTVTTMSIYDSDLFVGTEFNGVYRSVDLGNNWSQINSGLVNQNILSLFATGDGIFVSSESGLNYSTDEGNYWNSWNHGLPAAVLCFEENSPVLFVGTEGKGVYRSINNGISWIKISDGLTDSTINDLHVGGTYLYAAVEGSGIWRRPLSEITSLVKPNGGNISKAVSLEHSFPNPCGVATDISFSIPKSSRTNLIIHDIFGKVVAILLDEELEQGNYSVHFETINLPNGVYFYSLQVGDVLITRQLLVSK